jgi:hypothetical protein
LLKCRAENNARFQELAEKGRKYDMMNSTSIRQVQEAAVEGQQEGAEGFDDAEKDVLSYSLHETDHEQVEREVQAQLLFTQQMESLRMQLQARQREKDAALLELRSPLPTESTKCFRALSRVYIKSIYRRSVRGKSIGIF